MLRKHGGSQYLYHISPLKFEQNPSMLRFLLHQKGIFSNPTDIISSLSFPPSPTQPLATVLKDTAGMNGVSACWSCVTVEESRTCINIHVTRHTCKKFHVNSKLHRVDLHLLCVSLFNFGRMNITMDAVHHGFTAQNGLLFRSYHYSQSRLKHHGCNGGEEENGGSLEGGGRAAAVAVVGGA